MVLTAFSPRKDDFLDQLANLDENLQYSYLSRLEKYIVMNNEEEETEPKMIKGLEVIKEEEDEEGQKAIKNETEEIVEIKPIQVNLFYNIKKRTPTKSLAGSAKRRSFLEHNKHAKKSNQKEKEFAEFVKSVEAEMVEMTKKLTESENKRFDAELKLEESIKQINEIRSKRPSIYGGLDANYEKSVELNKLQKLLDDKIEEMDKLKTQTDKDLKKYLNEIENLQVKFILKPE